MYTSKFEADCLYYNDGVQLLNVLDILYVVDIITTT